MIAANQVATPEVEVDRDLVELARKGDREAFAVLVHQVSDGLYAVAWRILRDSGLAEDALQNALVLAWRRLPKLRDPERFEAWIHRILVHACYDESQRTRAWRRSVTVLPIELPNPTDDSSTIADRDELERLPLVEVAEILGVPAGTARSRLHYATAGLARPSRPSRTHSPGEDDSHDQRSIARTRRSIVARRGADARSRSAGRGGPRPYRHDSTGTGSPDPVEVANHE